MTKDEAQSMAMRLQAVFPTMNPAQGVGLAIQFEKYEVNDVLDAINEHQVTHKFVNGHDLMERVRIKAGGAVSPDDRREQARLEFEARYRQEKADKKKADGSIAAAFAAVQRLTPEERERHRAALIALVPNASPFLAARIKKADPTTSPMLASLIAQRMGLVKA